MKKFSKVKIVKEMARERVGQVPPTKRIPNKKKKKPKYKNVLEVEELGPLVQSAGDRRFKTSTV